MKNPGEQHLWSRFWQGKIRCIFVLACFLVVAFQANAQPTISAVLNGASFNRAVAPGSLVSLFGANLASSQLTAPSLPLPTVLSGTQVVIGGRPAPLYFVSPQQINFQIPFELAAGALPLSVSTPQGQSSIVQLMLAPMAPALFTRASNGTGRALVFNSKRFYSADSWEV